MAKPTLNHPVLGRFTYEDAYNWWAGRIDLRPGHPIDYCLSARGEPKRQPGELLDRGADFLNWARNAESLVLQQIADDLLDDYHDSWSSEDEGGMGPMSREQFLEHVTTSSIDVNADGSAYWYFSDGGLFAGHTIEVRVGADRTISEVCLAG